MGATLRCAHLSADHALHRGCWLDAWRKRGSVFSSPTSTSKEKKNGKLCDFESRDEEKGPAYRERIDARERSKGYTAAGICYLLIGRRGSTLVSYHSRRLRTCTSSHHFISTLQWTNDANKAVNIDSSHHPRSEDMCALCLGSSDANLHGRERIYYRLLRAGTLISLTGKKSLG